MTEEAFTSVPVIDLALADNPDTKPQFLEDLRYALFKVGFLYLINHGAEKEAKEVLDIAPKAFQVPTAAKEAVGMIRNPHFVGYTALGAEVTAQHTDIREQYDFGAATAVDPMLTEFDRADAKGEEYTLAEGRKKFAEPWRLIRGPTEYLPDSVLPGFKKTVTSYISAVQDSAERLLELIAESLNLPPKTFREFEGHMHRLKIVKYPSPHSNDSARVAANGSNLHDGTQFQGVGPHKDSSGLFTFVLQDNVGGLEVLNQAGKWVPVKPIENSLVVNIAQGFEALTGGRCGATTHQVISPPAHVTRYSIPYFHGFRMSLTKADIEKQCKFIQGKIPEPLDAKKRQVDVPSEFIQDQYRAFGDAHLRNRCVSHKDVAEKWYPKYHKMYNLGIE